jgi:hypothetical protein
MSIRLTAPLPQADEPICGNVECICCGSKQQAIYLLREIGADLAAMLDAANTRNRELTTALDEIVADVACICGARMIAARVLNGGAK